MRNYWILIWSEDLRGPFMRVGIAGLIAFIFSYPHTLAPLKAEKAYQRQMRCMAVYIYYCISAGSWYGFSLSCRRAYETMHTGENGKDMEIMRHCYFPCPSPFDFTLPCVNILCKKG